MSDNYIKVDNVSVEYYTPDEPFVAVKGASFQIEKGKTLGLVGESGCGKSTLGKAVIGLLPVSIGVISIDGKIVNGINPRKMQMIFQDPYASLNPRMRVEDCIGEAIDIHGLAKGSQRQNRIHELLDQVCLPKEIACQYPIELSGGQRQRVGIARALAAEPEFIFCDEPTSALDAHHQRKIVHLLQSLQKELNLTYLFVSHNLPLVSELSGHIAVMYKGQIVEYAVTKQLLADPQNSYTRKLLSAIPFIPEIVRPS